MIRLGRPHFAFFRGYLDGLDIGELAKRYLFADAANPTGSSQTDLRLAKTAVQWIRNQLLITARRSLSTAEARLLALPADKLEAHGVGPEPTLDQFREEHDPDDLYAEAELVALFQQVHGTISDGKARRVRRNQRLRARQQQALVRLESLVSTDPSPGDPIDAWIDPAIAARLQAVGVGTLAELVILIDRHGFHWYRRVPRIGRKAALQVGAWLQDATVREALGAHLSERAFKPRHLLPPAVSGHRETGIVPFERLLMPADPEAGSSVNRGPGLTGLSEMEAITLWLAGKPSDSHTYRSYRKEVERFFLWATIERTKALAALSTEDCDAYPGFLSRLGNDTPIAWASDFKIAQDQWIGPRGVDRASPFWRPFQGPLSVASQRQARIIVHNFLQWLTERRFLLCNPVLRKSSAAKVSDTALLAATGRQRLFSMSDMQALQAQMRRYAAQFPGHATCRLRCILALAGGCGLRLAELVHLQRGDLDVRHVDGAASWHLRVVNAIGVSRVVPVETFIVNLFDQYFILRGHHTWSEADPRVPLIAALPAATSGLLVGESSTEQALSVHRVHQIVKRFFRDAAHPLRNTDRTTSGRLQRASIDWLRLTFSAPTRDPGQPVLQLRNLLTQS